MDPDGCGMKSIWIIALVGTAIAVAVGATFLLIWFLLTYLLDYLV